MNLKELRKLAEARRTDARAAKTRRKRNLEVAPKKMGDLLSHYFQSKPQILDKIEESKAIMAWESIVGPSASLVSRALKMNGHSLVVLVQDPMWMQQLLLLKRVLIQKYRQKFPRLGIRDIFFTRFDNTGHRE